MNKRNGAPGRAARAAGAAGLLALLAGCGHGHRDVPTAPPPPPARAAPTSTAPAGVQAVPGRAPRERFAAAVNLLEAGNTAQARAELVALLAQRPGDRHATQLLREIDTDPHQIFGNDSFAYTVQAGDTLVSLAHRFLHDAVNFYGLARYNNLAFPAELQPGQTVLIPGRPRAPERTPTAPRRPAPAAPAASAPKVEEPARPAATSAADRGRAQKLRQQGLEQLSAGSIDRAVTLLSQASTLDPRNGAIAGELARARRIQATVRSR